MHKHPHTSPSDSNLDQDTPVSRSIAAARSVSDVHTSISPAHDFQKWEELAASEPSLLEPRQPASGGSTIHEGIRTIPSSHSIHSVSGSQKIEPPSSWTDSSSIHDEHSSKKKSSIRTSIKNMFTFKKRYVGHLGDNPHMLGQHLLTSPALSPSIPHTNLTLAQAYAAMASHHSTNPPTTHTHITTHDHCPGGSTSSLAPPGSTVSSPQNHSIPTSQSLRVENPSNSKQIHDCSIISSTNNSHDHTSSVQLNPALAHLNRPTIRVVHISSV